MLNRVRLWLRSIVLSGRLEREMQAEMAEHLERATARLIERGLSPEEARRQAMREFGNVVWLQEEARYARGTVWLDALGADVRFALRHFARKPWMTITMLVVLAAGMSITTLLFSYVHSYATLPPAGITLEDDLVRIRGSQTAGAHGRGLRTFSEAEFREYRDLNAHFAAVAGWTDATVTLDVDGERRGLQARMTFVTENYFPVVGVQPILGPGLSTGPGDPALTSSVMIGHFMWDQLLGRDPDVIGSTLSVNGSSLTVVGVAPQKFIGVTGSSRLQLWMPLEARRMLLPGAPAEFRAAGRLRPGVSPLEATAATRLVAARTATAHATLLALDPSTEVVPLLSASGDPMFERDVRLLVVWIGMFGVLVLLVTCTNVGGLLMGLAAARRHEIAVRLSLGAARTRILRQLLTESAFLATIAGTAALAIVWLVTRAATRLIPGLPFQLGITWSATLFTLGTALAIGIAFGLSPALHATRLGVASAMRDSAGMIAATRARMQRALVVAQIAFTQPLIVLLAAVLVLVIGEFQPLNRSKFADRVVALSISPATYNSSSSATATEAREQLRLAMSRVLDNVRDTPGVEAAVKHWTSVSSLGSWAAHPDDVAGGTRRDALLLEAATADAGHFDLLGIPVLRGREFEGSDAGDATLRTTERHVIIGVDLATRVWGGADAVGRRLQVVSDTAAKARTLVVMGVIADPIAETRGRGDAYRVYLPPDAGQPASTLLLRTTGPATGLVPALRTAVQEAAPGMTADLRTLADIEQAQRRAFRLITGALTAAGMIALLLSALGLYAVVAFSVGQRSGEIAVRMAFGARGTQIAQRFVGDGLRLSALGLVIGLPASLLGLHALTTIVTELPQVPLPPVTAMAGLGVIAVATAAAWIPARRAAAVEPAVTLRRE